MIFDLEKFLKLYEDFGIDLHTVNEDGGKTIYISTEDSLYFNGYGDIYSCATFDKNGVFTGQGFYVKSSDYDF